MSNPEYSAQVRRLAVLTLARWASEPCECEARRARTHLPPGHVFRLNPEHVECQACRSAKALARMATEPSPSVT